MHLLSHIPPKDGMRSWPKLLAGGEKGDGHQRPAISGTSPNTYMLTESALLELDHRNKTLRECAC
jgi:hypothetical protein